ncbi:50S Ribosomal protein [Senna tora]|uniref:50S Ribosomal protein n=1 Tax=Senna tora TaxID=362788 RepID=A0A834VZH9_9FABA|nr:50S Ribosomal protein [Senna tora]
MVKSLPNGSNIIHGDKREDTGKARTRKNRVGSPRRDPNFQVHLIPISTDTGFGETLICQEMIDCLALNRQVPSLPTKPDFLITHTAIISFFSPHHFRPLSFSNHSHFRPLRISRPAKATSAPMEVEPTQASAAENTASSPPMKLLFVEMGVGYDQHGQDITAAAMRACRDAISSNSIPAFRRGSIPGVTFDQMKLQIKLGVPHSLQQSLDIEKVKSVFPYSECNNTIHLPLPDPPLKLKCSGKIVNFEVVDGGLICSSGVHVEEMGDKNDDCYIVNAAVYVGY